jgi:hypothetical protein
VKLHTYRLFWSTGTTYYHQSLLLLAVCFRACTCLHHTRRCCIPALPPRDSTEEGVFIVLVCVAKVVFCLKLPSTTMTTISHSALSASVLEPVSVYITPVATAFQLYLTRDSPGEGVIRFVQSWFEETRSTVNSYHYHHHSQSLRAVCFCVRACTCLHHTRRCCIPALPPRDSTEEGVFNFVQSGVEETVLEYWYHLLPPVTTATRCLF